MVPRIIGLVLIVVLFLRSGSSSSYGFMGIVVDEEILNSMINYSSDGNMKSSSRQFDPITIEGEDIQLPSAKTLLVTKPPFEDSDIIKLTTTEPLIKSPNTIVTGYFRIPSKQSPEIYTGWMKNMLSLQDAMVIFTQADMIDTIKTFRSHAVNRTIIIPLEIEQLPYGTSLYTQEFWEDQFNRDPERKIHRSYELFWIWLSKSWFVTQAIRMNWFDSDLYVWSDIGCFRHTGFNSKTIVVHGDDVVPTNEMLFLAFREPNPPPENLYYDKYRRGAHFYHSGSIFAGRKATWMKFHEYFLDIIDQFLMKKMIIVDDQVILQSTCLTYPEICIYLPHTEVPQDNFFFGLRTALMNGGNLTYWRYKKEDNE